MILYKAQNELFFFMPVARPPDSMYMVGPWMPFQVFIIILFIAQCLQMIDLLLVQTQHDLFFIDWEQVSTF